MGCLVVVYLWPMRRPPLASARRAPQHTHFTSSTTTWPRASLVSKPHLITLPQSLYTTRIAADRSLSVYSTREARLSPGRPSDEILMELVSDSLLSVSLSLYLPHSHIPLTQHPLFHRNPPGGPTSASSPQHRRPCHRSCPHLGALLLVWAAALHRPSPTSASASPLSSPRPLVSSPSSLPPPISRCGQDAGTTQFWLRKPGHKY
jgi:hypothetical protein